MTTTPLGNIFAIICVDVFFGKSCSVRLQIGWQRFIANLFARANLKSTYISRWYSLGSKRLKDPRGFDFGITFNSFPLNLVFNAVLYAARDSSNVLKVTSAVTPPLKNRNKITWIHLFFNLAAYFPSSINSTVPLGYNFLKKSIGVSFGKSRNDNLRKTVKIVIIKDNYLRSCS